MSVLAAIATGNFTAAATWGLVDPTSYLNAETGSEVLTTAYSGTRSAAFTPGAITVSHLAVKLSVRTGTTGTISVSLRNATLGLDDFVAGTELAINCADLPAAVTADLNGGWVLFKLAAPVLLLAATNYNIQAKTSSATQVSLFRDGTADNLARCLVTTTTQAPAAGDDLIVAGEYTGAGTSNAFTVTMDNTATTDFGAASTSLVLPALAICSLGTLSFGSAAATAYLLKISGNIIVYASGTLNVGTVATPIPRGSSATIQFDCAVSTDFGLTVRNLATFIAQGLSRTVAKEIDRCKLNTDEAAAQTILGVDTDTGWLDTDVIAIATTTQTSGQCEERILSGNAGASSITATAGLTNAHSGTSPTQAEVVLLTRNVLLCGATQALSTYVYFAAKATVDCDWAEIRWHGSAAKIGIEIATTIGSCSINRCAIHTTKNVYCVSVYISSASGSNITFSNNISWNNNGDHLSIVASSGVSVVTGNIFMKNAASASYLLYTLDAGVTCAGNTFIGAQLATYDACVMIRETATLGTWGSLTFHGNGAPMRIGYGTGPYGTIDGITAWRNGFPPVVVALNEIIINNYLAFGNLGSNIQIAPGTRVELLSPIMNGDTSFSTAAAIEISSSGSSGVNGGKLIVRSGNLGTASGIKTAHSVADFSVPSACVYVMDVLMENTILASATEVSSQSNLTVNSIISSQKHDQVAGAHKSWKKYGTLTIETTTVHSPGVHSLKMTPNNASNKLDSRGAYGGFKVQVANGQTITPTVYVYEDAAYNGARARLVLKQNHALGITADVVLDTATAASDAAWEALTGTTAAVTDDGCLEFYIDCDGTAGNLFVGSVSAIAA